MNIRTNKIKYVSYHYRLTDRPAVTEFVDFNHGVLIAEIVEGKRQWPRLVEALEQCRRDGAVLVTADGWTRLPAHPITPVDTPSCGDSYCAGVIAGLDRGWPLEQACRLGGAVSARVAQGLGTLGALTGFEDAFALMSAAI